MSEHEDFLCNTEDGACRFSYAIRDLQSEIERLRNDVSHMAALVCWFEEREPFIRNAYDSPGKLAAWLEDNPKPPTDWAEERP